MMDLRDRLSLIAGETGETSAEQAEADLNRARGALGRRRAVQRVGASAFAVAALAAAVAYGTTSSHPAEKPAAISTHLVAYQGEQPKGFTIDKVPSGWEVQGVSDHALTIAPVDATDKDPDSFVGKIAIMLQSADDHSTPSGTAVTVGGQPGVINKGQGTDHGRNLWVKEPNGVWMEVQIWDGRGWTDADLVEFGKGVHVLKDAVQGRG